VKSFFVFVTRSGGAKSKAEAASSYNALAIDVSAVFCLSQIAGRSIFLPRVCCTIIATMMNCRWLYDEVFVGLIVLEFWTNRGICLSISTL